MRTVIFDLDGTLANTSGDLIAAANICLRDLGAGEMLDLETDQGVAMKAIKPLLRLGLDRAEFTYDDDTLHEYYDATLKAYGENISNHTYFYPGALDAIENLKSDGYAVGICTNKPIGLAESMLRSFGLQNTFNSMIGAGSLAVKKPDPEAFIQTVKRANGNLAKSVLIGDTVTDLETARGAGIPSVLVTFGPDGRDVAGLNPDALLDHYDDLGPLVARLIG